MAALPLIAVLVVMGWQLAFAGYTAWITSSAARFAARAQAVGRDPDIAARSVLPSGLEKNLQVTSVGAGAVDPAVRVRVKVPFLLPRWQSPFHFEASAGMERQTA